MAADIKPEGKKKTRTGEKIGVVSGAKKNLKSEEKGSK